MSAGAVRAPNEGKGYVAARRYWSGDVSAAVGVVSLALGVRGPSTGRAFRGVRNIVVVHVP